MFSDLYIYLGVALAGLVSFLSPCVLPLVPPYLGYLGGTTVSQAATAEGIDNAVWRRIVIGSVFFVLGFSTIFVGFGAAASAFGQLIATYKSGLSVLAGLVIIVFGLHFLGLVRIPLLYVDARYHGEVGSASHLGAYVLGLAFAFGWTPCIGPILSTVLAVAASEATLSTGVTLLAAYSLGLGIPFVLAAIAMTTLLALLFRVTTGTRPPLAFYGLVALSLPVLPSLQFVLGYPLRIVSAALTVALLKLQGLTVAREGTHLLFAGEAIQFDESNE